MAHELGGDASTGKVWVGAAHAVNQVTTWVFAGTWEVGDEIDVTINGRTQTFTATSATTATTVSGLVTDLNDVDASENPEIARITWSANSTSLIGTVDQAGVPIIITIATYESGGGAADAQTIDGSTSSTGTATVAASGPNFFNDTTNWRGGLPVDGDSIVITGNAPSILYGLDLSSVSLDGIRIDKSFTGRIGLPRINEYGSYEANERFLKVGAVADTRTTDIFIGLGEGTGSDRIYIDNNDARANLYVFGTARTPNEEHCVVWKSTNANSTVHIQGGNVGIATNGREIATVATANINAIEGQDPPKVRFGNGVTLTTLNIYGGNVRTESAVTTGTIRGGTWRHYSGNVTTLNTYAAGKFYWLGNDTINTLNNAGEFNANESTNGGTVAAANLYKGCAYKDVNGKVALSTGLALIRCGLQDVTIQIAEHKTLTIT